MAAKTIKVTQIGSPIGRPEKQRATLIGPGPEQDGQDRRTSGYACYPRNDQKNSSLGQG